MYEQVDYGRSFRFSISNPNEALNTCFNVSWSLRCSPQIEQAQLLKT